MVSRHEGAHRRVIAPVTQRSRRAMRDRRSRLRIQEDAVIADPEQAGQFMAHDDDGGAETLAQLENQVIEPAGGDRIQSRRRLVEEQDFGVEGEGSRKARALAHASRKLGRPPAGGRRQSHERELEPDENGDRVGVRLVNICSGSATFSATVIELQSAPLWNRTPKRRPMAARRASVAAQ